MQQSSGVDPPKKHHAFPSSGSPSRVLPAPEDLTKAMVPPGIALSAAAPATPKKAHGGFIKGQELLRIIKNDVSILYEFKDPKLNEEFRAFGNKYWHGHSMEFLCVMMLLVTLVLLPESILVVWDDCSYHESSSLRLFFSTASFVVVVLCVAIGWTLFFIQHYQDAHDRSISPEPSPRPKEDPQPPSVRSVSSMAAEKKRKSSAATILQRMQSTASFLSLYSSRSNGNAPPNSMHSASGGAAVDVETPSPPPHNLTRRHILDGARCVFLWCIQAFFILVYLRVLFDMRCVHFPNPNAGTAIAAALLQVFGFTSCELDSGSDEKGVQSIFLFFLPVIFFKSLPQTPIRCIWLNLLSAVFIFVAFVFTQEDYIAIASGIVWMSIAFFLVRDIQVRNMLIFLSTRDARETMVSQNKALEESHATEMRHLIANVAHDLKTPLASFTTGLDFIQLALDDFQESRACSDDAVSEMVSSIEACVLNIRNTNLFMLMTINRCIDYTKVSKGIKLLPRYETIDLMETIQLPLSCMQNIQSKVSISVEPMSARICSHVITDRLWLQENLLCLLSNAVKYSNGGEVTITLRLGDENCDDLEEEMYLSVHRQSPISPSVRNTQNNNHTNSNNSNVNNNNTNNNNNNKNNNSSSSSNSNNNNRELSKSFTKRPTNSFSSYPGVGQSSSAGSLHPYGQRDEEDSVQGSSSRRSSFHNPPNNRSSMSTPRSVSINGNGRLNMASVVRSLSQKRIDRPAMGGSSNYFADFLVIEVEDTGIGLADGAMEMLFKPFNQTQRLAGGTGLGLFSLAKRMEALKGKYGVKRRKDGRQGSLFWFAIPYLPDQYMADLHNHAQDDGPVDELVLPLAIDTGDYNDNNSNNENENDHDNYTDNENNGDGNGGDQYDERKSSKSSKSSKSRKFDASPITSATSSMKNKLTMSDLLPNKLLIPPPIAILESSEAEESPLNVKDTKKKSEIKSKNKSHQSKQNTKNSNKHISNNAKDSPKVRPAEETVQRCSPSFAPRTPSHAGTPSSAVVIPSLAAATAHGAAASLAESKNDAFLRVLVVDDSPSILKMSSMMLRKLGHKVSTAENGQEAVDAVREHMDGPSRFDLVLMDLQMPIMDGLEAAKRMRAIEDPNDPHFIIGCSANSDSETLEAALEAGMDRFMSKPFNLTTFCNVIADMPNRKD